MIISNKKALQLLGKTNVDKDLMDIFEDCYAELLTNTDAMLIKDCQMNTKIRNGFHIVFRKSPTLFKYEKF